MKHEAQHPWSHGMEQSRDKKTHLVDSQQQYTQGGVGALGQVPRSLGKQHVRGHLASSCLIQWPTLLSFTPHSQHHWPSSSGRVGGAPGDQETSAPPRKTQKTTETGTSQETLCGENRMINKMLWEVVKASKERNRGWESAGATGREHHRHLRSPGSGDQKSKIKVSARRTSSEASPPCPHWPTLCEHMCPNCLLQRHRSDWVRAHSREFIFNLNTSIKALLPDTVPCWSHGVKASTYEFGGRVAGVWRDTQVRPQQMVINGSNCPSRPTTC